MGLLSAGVSIAMDAVGMMQSNKDAKANKELLKKQAEQNKETTTFNYKTYIENNTRDYMNNMYDMSNKYAQAYSSLNLNYDSSLEDLQTNYANDPVASAGSSYYNDMKNEINNQYDSAVTDLYSTMDNNMYRTQMSYNNTSEQKHQEYIDNLKRAELNLDANEAQVKSNYNQAMTNGLFKMASAGVDAYYKGDLQGVGLAPTMTQAYGSQGYQATNTNYDSYKL